jgi:hypothetical protein
LVQLYHPVKDKHCMNSKDLGQYLDDLNAKLYCFVSGLPDPSETKCFFADDEISRRRGS